MTEPIHPEITVRLTGRDGNIFNLVGIASEAMKRAGLTHKSVDNMMDEVFNSSDYDSALAAIMKWVNVE